MGKSYPNPKMMARIKEFNEKRKLNGYNSMQTSPVHGAQSTVFILIEGTSFTFPGPGPIIPGYGSATFNPALRDARNWTGLMNEMDTYYNEVSRGILRVKPAEETFGTVDDGIIGPVSVPYLSPSTTNSLSGFLAVEAIKAANPYIDYTSFDRNLDGQLDSDELHIVIIQAGYDSDYTYPYPSPGPSTPATTYATDPIGYYYGYPGFSLAIPGLLPQFDSDNVAITSYMYMGSEFYTPGKTTRVGLGIAAHEFGHDLGLPDLYDVDTTGTTVYYPVTNTNGQTVLVPFIDPSGYWSGLGPYCLMSGGGWGEDAQATKPSHLCGYLKSYLGWAQESVVTAPTNQTLSLPAAKDSNALVRVNVPGSTECFIVENRQQFGYDAALPGTQGGLAIYHVDETRFFEYPQLPSPAWPLFYNTEVNNEPQDAGIRIIQADGSNSLMLPPPRYAPYYAASDRDLFRLGNVSAFNALTSPSSNLQSGGGSGLAISNISASGPVMTFNLTHTNQIGFAQRQLTVREEAKQASIVVNLSPAAENNVSIDYNWVGGSATSGTDYKMTGGTLTFEPGQTSKYFTIDLINDSLVEGHETIQLALSNPKGAVLGTTDSQALITINDNDSPYLNLVYPNGGEALAQGSNVKVVWTANKTVIGDQINIDLYADGLYERTLKYRAPSTAALGAKMSYTVTLPTGLPLGPKYKIAVVAATDPSFTDQSDENFSIIDPNLRVANLTVADGAAVTTTRLVSVKIDVPAGVNPTHYMISERPDFAGAQWLPFAANTQFMLSKGDYTRGVFVRIRKDGQISGTVTRHITLKEAPAKPVIQAIPNATVAEHQPYVGPAPVLTAGERPVVWSLVSGPAGLLINPGSGVVTWKDPNRVSSPALIKIRATNAAGSTDVQWQVRVEVRDMTTALNDSKLSWATGGDHGWYAQSLVTHDGESAARSKAQRDGQKATMATTVTGPGTLGFWWRVSSEPVYDSLSFSMNGAKKAAISGEQDWAYYQIAIPAGKQELRWTYAKDLGRSAGQDAGFVDQVSWQPGLQVTDLSRSGYVVSSLQSGCRLYSDNRLTEYVGSIPEPLKNQVYIRTASADYKSVSSSLFKFKVDQPVTVILAVDERFSNPPSWAKNFKKLGFSLQTTAPKMNLYARQFKAGEITLGGNCDGGNPKGYKMYGVILVPSRAIKISELSKSSYDATGTVRARGAVTGSSTYSDPVSPLYSGARVIRTSSKDNKSCTSSLFSFKVDRPVTVVVGFDEKMKTRPRWASRWQSYGDKIKASDGTRKLYAKHFGPGTITLGGNVSEGVKTSYRMYTVIVLPSY